MSAHNSVLLNPLGFIALAAYAVASARRSSGD